MEDGATRVAVDERLAALEERYDSFPVNQTTLSVPAEHYERARKRVGTDDAEVIAVVHNDDDEVLLGEGTGGWVIPRGTTEAGESLEDTARRVVRDAAGVECTIDAVLRASIEGLRNDADPDAPTVYRLRVAFDAAVADADDDRSRRWTERAVPR